jgi:lysine-specific histone demethylase 1
VEKQVQFVLGDHCLLRDGYSSIARKLSEGIDLKTKAVVEHIQYSSSGVKVQTQDGNVYEADYAVVTLPLGVLKERYLIALCTLIHSDVKFTPSLPEWKTNAIQRLGFGLLNKVRLRFYFSDLKVALCFPHVFWNDDLDYFGQTTPSLDNRGEYYLFWNLHRYQMFQLI